jgi:hypothetical protein
LRGEGPAHVVVYLNGLSRWGEALGPGHTSGGMSADLRDRCERLILQSLRRGLWAEPTRVRLHRPVDRHASHAVELHDVLARANVQQEITGMVRMLAMGAGRSLGLLRVQGARPCHGSTRYIRLVCTACYALWRPGPSRCSGRRYGIRRSLS